MQGLYGDFGFLEIERVMCSNDVKTSTNLKLCTLICVQLRFTNALAYPDFIRKTCPCNEYPLKPHFI